MVVKINYRYYSLCRRLKTLLFVGLFLQACSGGDGLPVSLRKRQQHTSRPVPRQRTINHGSQLKEEEQKDRTQAWLVQGEHYECGEVNNGKLHQRDNVQKKEKQGMNGKKKKRQTKKRKRSKDQENEQKYLNEIKHRKLENSAETTEKVKKKRRRKKSGSRNRKGSIIDAKQERSESSKANQQVGGKSTKKRRRLRYGTENLRVLEKANKQVKKKRKNSIGTRRVKLLDLPGEIIQNILFYLPFSSRMLTNKVNHLFYTLNTGYNQVGLVGIAHKPDYDPRTATWSIDKLCATNKLINFNFITCTPETIPSFAFYVLMRQVAYLPQQYWTYIKETQIRKIGLGWDKTGGSELTELSQNLKHSKVTRLHLWYDAISPVSAAELAKGLSGDTNVCEVDLSNNNLWPESIEWFAKNLPKDTNVREINLSNNKLGYLEHVDADVFTKYLPNTIRKINLSSSKIKAKGAIEVTTHLQDKEVEEIDLRDNKIKAKGAVGILKNLQGTSVERLYLGCNGITDKGIVRVAQNLLGTNLEELCLGGNKIANQGAVEIVKRCRGTKIKKLNLSFNRGITDEGTLEIAKNLKGTELEEIDLRQRKVIGEKAQIAKETQQLVKKKYPYIKWVFEKEKIESLDKGDQQHKMKEKRKVRFMLKSQGETETPIPNTSGATKRVKRKKKNVGDDKITKLRVLDLPRELLEGIVSYLSFEEAMVVRQLNHYFYEFITGYDRVGMAGILHKPSRSISMATYSINKTIDLSVEASPYRPYRVTTIPSFIFYQLMRKVRNLPPIYWPYLAGTQVYTVDLESNKLGDSRLLLGLLGKCLQESKVHTIFLGDNEIEYYGAKAFFKKLRYSNVQEVDLKHNELGDEGVSKLAEYLPKTKLQKINLSRNEIRGSGVARFSECLKNTDIQEVDLSDNELGNEGVIEFGKHLKRTNVHTVNLESNRIGDQGVIGFAKNLRKTKIHTVYLYGNPIRNKGAKQFAAYLKGSQVHIVRLNGYRFIKDKTRSFLQEQHPDINW